MGKVIAILLAGFSEIYGITCVTGRTSKYVISVNVTVVFAEIRVIAFPF